MLRPAFVQPLVLMPALVALIAAGCGDRSADSLACDAPQARYVLDGWVRNGLTDEPIPDLDIYFRRSELPQTITTATTDSLGRWAIVASTFPFGFSPSSYGELVLIDPDEMEGGGYFGVVRHRVAPVQTHQGNGCDYGIFEQHAIEIRLHLYTGGTPHE